VIQFNQEGEGYDKAEVQGGQGHFNVKRCSGVSTGRGGSAGPAGLLHLMRWRTGESKRPRPTPTLVPKRAVGGRNDKSADGRGSAEHARRTRKKGQHQRVWKSDRVERLRALGEPVARPKNVSGPLIDAKKLYYLSVGAVWGG